MKIYLIRHGIAADRMSWYEADHLRPLVPKGIEKMKLIAKALKKLGIQFEHIFSSPYVRAYETAELVADGLGFRGEIEKLEMLEPGGIPSDLFPVLNKLGRIESVAMFGHNPHMERAISYFISGDYNRSVMVKKGSVAIFDGYVPLRPQYIEFQGLLQPKQLVEMA